MRTGLVVSGGGSKGAFAVGAIEVLREHGYQFDMVAGTSTGALIAPMVALDDIDKLVELYTNVSNKDIIRLNWRRLFWNALYDTTPLKNVIANIISAENRYERLMRSRCTILLCAVCMQTSEIVYFSQNNKVAKAQVWQNQDEFVRAVLASTNQPVFTDLPTIGNMQYADGGIREVIPLDILYGTDLDRIIVIINSPGGTSVQDKKFKSIIRIGPRTLDIMGTEIGKNDLRTIIEYNRVLEDIDRMRARASQLLPASQVNQIFGLPNAYRQPKELIIIRPETSLGFDGLSFDPKNMRKARLIGQDTARRVLNA